MEYLKSIKKILKKKKERILFDIFIKDYDKSNFYLALLYSEQIEKYKALFVPIDAINNGKNIEEYFCYQFINVNTVDNLVKKINQNDMFLKQEKIIDYKIPELDSYYIEINSNILDKEYTFKFSQFIDEDCLFLFDVIVVLFEHAPHIVNELCMKILSSFQSKKEAFHYNISLDANFQNIDKYFKKEIINSKEYKISMVRFLEQIASRYYSIVNNHLIVIDYNRDKEIINIYAEDINPMGIEVYLTIQAIKKEQYKNFYYLQVVEAPEDFSRKGLGDYYLSYGILDDEFQIIDASKQEVIPLSLLKKKCIKIYNMDKELEKTISNYLNDSYEEFKVEELIDFAKENN